MATAGRDRTRLTDRLAPLQNGRPQPYFVLLRPAYTTNIEIGVFVRRRDSRRTVVGRAPFECSHDLVSQEQIKNRDFAEVDAELCCGLQDVEEVGFNRTFREGTFFIQKGLTAHPCP